jgi:hypothetical protein
MSEELVGRAVVDPHGHKVGTIDALYLYGEDEVWARVKMGLLGTDSALVPLGDAQEDDDDVRIVYEREHVKAAPEIEPEDEKLSDEAADALHGHYGLERVKGLTAELSDEDIKLPRETRDAQPPGMDEDPDAPLPKRRRKRQEELKQAAEEFEQAKGS